MTQEKAVTAGFYALLLLLPLSALVARRIAWRRSGAMALGWIAIFVLMFALFAGRDRLLALVGGPRHGASTEARPGGDAAAFTSRRHATVERPQLT